MATLSSAAARTLTTAPTIGPSLPCSTPNTDRRYADGGCAMTFRMCGVRTLSAASPATPGPADCAPGSSGGDQGSARTSTGGAKVYVAPVFSKGLSCCHERHAETAVALSHGV